MDSDFFYSARTLFYKALSLLFATFSYSLSDLILPSEIATPIVKYASPKVSSDGFPINIDISISRYNLILSLNELLISPQFTSTILDEDNKQTSRKKLKNCYYQGKLEPFEYDGTKFHDWRAGISLCQGLQGHFGNSMDGYIVILPNVTNSTTVHQQHYLHHVLESGTRFTHPVNPLRVNFFDNSFNIGQQQQLAEFPFIELQVVNDKCIYDSYGKDVDRLEFNNAIVINEVDFLYNSLGIDVILISIVTWKTKNMVDAYDDIDKMLFSFGLYNLQYRPYKYDIAVLLSSFQIGYCAGIAQNGGACGKYNVVFVGTDVSNLHFIAATVAHEIGHTLGMKHDEEFPDDECTCNDTTGYCIMTKEGDGYNIPEEWSSCSQRTAKRALKNSEYRCLYIMFGGVESGLKTKNKICRIFELELSIIYVFLLDYR